MPPLLHRGSEYYMAQDKADILATHFQTIHRLTLPQKINRHATIVENAVLKFNQKRRKYSTDKEIDHPWIWKPSSLTVGAWPKVFILSVRNTQIRWYGPLEATHFRS